MLVFDLLNDKDMECECWEPKGPKFYIEHSNDL